MPELMKQVDYRTITKDEFAGILQKGVLHINEPNDCGDFPIHITLSKGRNDLLELLLEFENLDINIKNEDDKTALYIACVEGKRWYQ